MKSYTDLDQSRKLAGILSIESADMWYHGHGSPWESEREYDSDACPFHSMRPNWDIPCWSLATLLSVLDFPSLIQNKEDEWEVCVPNHKSDGYIEVSADNPVDACVEIILEIHKQKKE